MTTISRRNLLAGSAAAGVALAAPVLKAAPLPEKWDETVEVLIIGSGFAGLAAAIEAKKLGANVLIVEKMPTAGGNSIINGGLMAAPNCEQQKLHGYKDSVELFEQDVLVAGQYLNNREKVRFLAEHALENYEWTVKELGVEYRQDTIFQEGGHSVPRAVQTMNGSGSGIVLKELDRVKELNISIRTRCYVERIIRDEESGAVLGLKVREGYRFPNEGSGREKYIRATMGVVLCYGGFAADLKYRMYQDPKLTPDLTTTNQPGATSELWRRTAALGCLQVQNDWIQCGPWGNPKEKGMGIGWQFNQNGAAEFGLWVNSDGKRFVNELANRKVRADAIMVEQSKGKKCWAIVTEPNLKALKNAREGIIDTMMERKLIERFDTLDALAKAYDINVENLKKQVEAFNTYVQKKEDPEFKRFINKEQTPLVEGPWYVSPLQPKVHHCMGGLVTDMGGRVIDVLTDKPIPHLYAAGEATSGVHGAVRLGTVATVDCLLFGREAGKAIVADNRK